MANALKLFILSLADKVSRSQLTPIFAALAVITAASLSFLASQLASDSVACDIRREKSIAEGSPYLRYAREGTLRSYKAPMYLALARLSVSMDLKRQNAYHAIAAVNESIMVFSQGMESSPDLWSYPNESELSSLAYYAKTFDKMDKLYKNQVVKSIRSHDNNFAVEMADADVCDSDQSIANFLNFLAVLISVLSVGLIALREYKADAR